MMLTAAATLIPALLALAGPPPVPANKDQNPSQPVPDATSRSVGQWLTLPVTGLRLKVPKGPAVRVETSGLLDGTGPRLLAQDGLRFFDDGGRTPAMATVEVGVSDCDHLTKPVAWPSPAPPGKPKFAWQREDRPVDNGRIAVILCRGGMNQEWLVPSAQAAADFDEWRPWVEALALAWTVGSIDSASARAQRPEVFVQEATPSGPPPLGPPACALGPAGYAPEPAPCVFEVPRFGWRLTLPDLWYTNDTTPAPAGPRESILRLAIPAAAQLTVVLRDGPTSGASPAAAACPKVSGRLPLAQARMPKGWSVQSTVAGAPELPWRLCFATGQRTVLAEVTSALPAPRVPEFLVPLLGAIASALAHD